MARLTPAELEEMVGTLVTEYGLGRVRERLQRLNVVVSSRHLGSAASLSRLLYPLTGGLGRDVPATRAVLALWEELLASRVDEEVARKLEELAQRINSCLDEKDEVIPERREELREAISSYRECLRSKVGDSMARLTMLSRAVPEVARWIRDS
jgi:hypothetical protein